MTPDYTSIRLLSHSPSLSHYYDAYGQSQPQSQRRTSRCTAAASILVVATMSLIVLVCDPFTSSTGTALMVNAVPTMPSVTGSNLRRSPGQGMGRPVLRNAVPSKPIGQGMPHAHSNDRYRQPSHVESQQVQGKASDFAEASAHDESSGSSHSPLAATIAMMSVFAVGAGMYSAFKSRNTSPRYKGPQLTAAPTLRSSAGLKPKSTPNDGENSSQGKPFPSLNATNAMSGEWIGAQAVFDAVDADEGRVLKVVDLPEYLVPEEVLEWRESVADLGLQTSSQVLPKEKTGEWSTKRKVATNFTDADESVVYMRIARLQPQTEGCAGSYMVMGREDELWGPSTAQAMFFEDGSWSRELAKTDDSDGFFLYKDASVPSKSFEYCLTLPSVPDATGEDTNCRIRVLHTVNMDGSKETKRVTVYLEKRSSSKFDNGAQVGLSGGIVTVQPFGEAPCRKVTNPNTTVGCPIGVAVECVNETDTVTVTVSWTDDGESSPVSRKIVRTMNASDLALISCQNE